MILLKMMPELIVASESQMAKITFKNLLPGVALATDSSGNLEGDVWG